MGHARDACAAQHGRRVEQVANEHKDAERPVAAARRRKSRVADERQVGEPLREREEAATKQKVAAVQLDQRVREIGQPRREELEHTSRRALGELLGAPRRSE